MVTGRGQGVLVHVDAGTANAAMGIHNAYRGRVPVLLMAGKAPYTSRGELPGSRDTLVHFIQEPFDQAALVRPFSKWEYTLPSGVTSKEVLRRAHSVMQSDPPGPVYLTFARETLTESWRPEQVSSYAPTDHGPVRAAGADPVLVDRVARELVRAEFPVLYTTYGGRNTEFPVVLDELSSLAGLRVVSTQQRYVNLRTTSPCCVGFFDNGLVTRADFGLLVDVDVPWIPKRHAPAPGAFWAHVDIDPLKSGTPVWDFPAQLRVHADSTRFLRQLLERVRELANSEALARMAQRKLVLEQEHAERVAERAARAARPGHTGAIQPEHLFALVARHLAAGDIVVADAVRYSFDVMEQIPRTLPGTFIGLTGAGLGFSGGGALGVKLAARDPLVVCFVGDGGFYFNNPLSALAVGARYRLPVLTVVVDNGGWKAVKDSTLDVYPNGEAAAANEFGARFAPDIDLSQLAACTGAHGERVAEPDRLPAAVARAVEAVRGGRSAVLQVQVTSL
jgi:acetolactate synthase-1/2/3 large subunit